MITPGNVICTDILLFDVVEFSRLTTSDQYKTALLFSDAARQTTINLAAASFLKPSEFVVGLVATGDGFYVLLDSASSGYGLFFALSMRNSLLISNKRAGSLFKGVRAAINTGEAVPFIDLTNSLNFVGDGMNDTARLF